MNPAPPQSPPATGPLLRAHRPHDPLPEAILNAFVEAAGARGLTLYPEQQEAILEVMGGSNVILATPTGSGKSLVALAMHFKGFCEGKRSFYTCPIKALVSEKFFALCADFGADNVGMLTGDAAINRDAPIICCTAEVLANIALAEGQQANVDYVIMDEFHYYTDRDRGVAWQVPLLTLPQATFLLMSATLGNVGDIERHLRDLTAKPVATVRSQRRPVPLDFSYRETPLHETLAELIRQGRYPIYLVSFTQRDCAEQAQNAMSVDICDKTQKRAIADALKGFRFDSPYGKDVRRYVSHGIGLHHAGLLPKYRLLVERLAQDGLLKIIMGTDTLGVGVNIPIRTVLFTKLCKFDGERVQVLSVRDFQQIAGRAGRKGFDDQGSVVCQAPEHVIENKRAAERADLAAKKRKPNKKKPPNKNYVHWDQNTFQRLIDDLPEPLKSQFCVTHGMIITVLQAQENPQVSRTPHGGYGTVVDLIARSHDSAARKTHHRRLAARLFKSLRRSGIVKVVHQRHMGQHVGQHVGGSTGAQVQIDGALQRDFSLHHTLSLYLLSTIDGLDRESDTYPLDVLTLVEAILDNPRAILMRQVDKQKAEKIAELKTQGVPFEERLEQLDQITYPKPNAEFIYATFNAFVEHHPWVADSNIHPKSIAREIFETWSSFRDYVRDYGLQRLEGVLLRYLSQVYKTLVQTVPESMWDERLEEIMAFLRTLLEHVDASLLHAWEELLQAPDNATSDAQAPPPPHRVSFHPRVNPRAFRARIRAEMHQVVKCLAQRDYETAACLFVPNDDDPWSAERIEKALLPYYDTYEQIVATPRARAAHLTTIKELTPNTYQVQQILVDPEEDNLWAVTGRISFDTDTAADTETTPDNALANKLVMLVQIGN